MIDDLIPFLIFIGVALINLIKTAIERGGAKLAPPSNTKKELTPVGIDYLRKGFNQTLLPAFAIGGINSSNINKLNQIKNLRIAISDAIINSSDPFTKTKELFKFLT